MTCTACGHVNRAGRKFCAECGAALALACAACSAPYEAGEKFCGECGASLGAAPPRPTARIDMDAGTGALAGREAVDAGARKVVTIVFADLVGSTALHERLDAESARRVMERYYEALRAAVDAHGGTVVKLLGDGVMAAFGLKRVAEDDALRAVRAAAAMQDAFRVLIGVEAALAVAGLRVAVNTGEVVVSGARDDVIGDPVNVAARLQEQGGDGDVVLGEATRRLVATRVTLAPLGSVTLKGRAEAVAAYRLESLDPPAGAAAVPFVGRETEMARLEAVYEAAVATPATRLAVLLGSPGLGKSRLIDELGARHADGATILAAHCDATGGATFAPLAQVLRGFLGLDDGADGDAVRAAVSAALSAGDEGERARIAGGIAGLLGGTATSPEETFFVVRRFLAGLAAARPLVLVIDDLHWAEPLLLDLVEHLVQWGAGVPLFVLVGARPELRDLRSSLVTPGGLVAEVVTLGGLDAGAAMRLAANVIGATDLPAAVAAKVLATSEGNPLFVGELVRMLVQEGALTKDGERWIVGAGLASLEMPPTIHALLAARIERLGSEERTVLERASVVGRHFSRSAVAALLGRNGTALDARLESLRRSELIERDTGWLLGEPVMRFHHVLIRDAAYRRLLKGTRAELHARLADWIEGQVGDAPEHDEMIGWHLEQAHQHLRELGPLDAAAVVLGERAARRLAAAGRRALARDDVSLAAGLCGRALDRLTPEAPERADLVLDWCEALLAAGDVGPAADAIAELERVAGDSPRLRAWHTCFAGQLTVLTAPEALHVTADRVGAAARELATLNDAAGEAKAHFVHAQALARLGKVGACEAALDQALAAARRAGDRRRANAVLAGAPLAALWGPSPVTRASGRCLDVVRVLRITQGAPAVEAVALSCQGVLEALRGRTEAARRMLASSRTMVEELGISHRLYETDVFAGRIDLLEGDAPAAERALRAGYDGLRDLGLGIDAARAAALLGRALLAQDRAAEAETLSHESELLAGDDLQAAIAWRGVRAEALARRGDHAAAITFAEAAVAIAAATDALLDHADARLALAAAFRAGGRRAEADAEERRAFELWEAKGATVLAERARRAADGEVPAAPPPETRAEPRVQRRVRPNAGSAAMARVEAALAARDLAAMGTFAESFEEVSHPTGATYGREQMLLSLDRFLRLPGATVRHELLATLGDRLWLFRRWMGASAAGRERFDVGEYEKEEIGVNEIDEHGAHLRNEIFGADHLGDAIALLYRRYAEGLPSGPARERATVAARAVAFILLPGETPDLNLLYAPTYVDVDHRTVGYGALSREQASKLAESFQTVADDVRFRIDDVLVLDPNGLVRKTTSSGVWREGGGAFERAVCTLTVFGPDGRVTGYETFDADREAEALARFAVLTADAQPKPPVQRRVRPNAVTRVSAELDGIVAARDFTALETYFAQAVECIDHPTGATYGAADIRTGLRRLMQSPDAHLRTIPLASLGASWGLTRFEMSASGAVGRRFDVGAYEIVNVRLQGTDERGRIRHVEIFATERLGAAIVRLYERHAEHLPGGPASTRARAIARSLAVFDGPIEFDRIANAYAPSFEAVDRRILGTWSAQGREEVLTHWRGQLSLADDSGGRYDEVLALEPGAILVHQSFWGSSRASGGVFEVVTLVLQVFDGDGLIARTELFEPDREAEALARFAALTADAAPRPPVRRRVRPNAATAAVARFDAAIAARDMAALAAMCAEALAVVEHPVGATYGRDGVLASFQRLLRMDDPTMHEEPLATLGESLALFRRRISGSGGRLGVGVYERDEICIYEVDADGRFLRVEAFATERLRAALVRFYECYAESLPEGRERTRATGIARSSSTYDGSIDADRIATGLAPTFVCVDHRTLGTWSAQSREEWLTHWRAQGELTAGFTCRDDDILALAPTALLVRETFFGTNRIEGGLFENVILALLVFGADGLYGLAEIFEPEREAEALARFDVLTAGAAPRQSVQRRVRPPRALRANTATATFAAIADAFARRDLAAVDALLGDPLETIEHPTGTTYGREGQLESSRRMMRMPDLDFRIEPLATLGDAFCLARRVVGASGTAGGKFDVGAYEIESIVVNGVDAAGRLTSAEVFASDHLCQAIARLYALYAESLPDGPERTRAAGIASSHAVWDRPLDDFDRFMSVFAPSFVCVDHRSLGTWSVEGRDEFLQHWRGQNELTDGFSRRDDDILALAPGANLTRRTMFGINRATGGLFENVLLHLDVFGADGLYTHCELFEPDQEAEALARFDELTAPSTPSIGRRVRANAATGTSERLWAAIARRDGEAFGRELADDFELVHHPTGAAYGRRGMLSTWRSLFKAKHFTYDPVILGTLGDALVLHRHALSADGFVEERLAVAGLIEMDEVVVDEVGADGRFQHMELFAGERLGDAIACAYARHAERLPAGPTRERAAMTARAAAAMLTRSTEHRLEDVSTPDIEAIDHRSVGMGAVTGSDLWTRWRAASDELMQDPTYRIEDVLALSHDGLLRRTTEAGTVRASGGAFENSIWILSIFGPDGRQSRIELFDVGREAEALARYDALVGLPGEPTAHVVSPFANAATRTLDRFVGASAAHDWQALADCFAPSLRFDDRRPLLRMQLPQDGFLEQHRVLFDVPNGRWVTTAIATRGERLVLARLLFQGDVAGGGGALEIDHLSVLEVDDGRMNGIVLFEPADLDAAYAELDARFEAGETSPLAVTHAVFSRAFANRDWETVTAICAPTFVEHDHRHITGLGTTRGPEAWVQRNVRVWTDLAPDTVARRTDVRASERGYLSRVVLEGSREGGRFELPLIIVTEADTQGRLARADVYDDDQLDEAGARFAELRRLPAQAAEPFANAASRTDAELFRCFNARDWPGVLACAAPELVFDERRRLVRNTCGREIWLEQFRLLFDVPASRFTTQLRATRGERLSLNLHCFTGEVAHGGGPLAMDDHFVLYEVDGDGRIVAILLFDLEDTDVAYAELDRRYEAGEGAMHRPIGSAYVRAIATRDWGAIAALCAPTFTLHDHRSIAVLGTVRGPAAWVQSLRALVDLAPDSRVRLDHIRHGRHGFLWEMTEHGSREGGRFELRYVGATELDAQGRLARIDFYDPEALPRARARFDEVERRPSPMPSAEPFANAATRALARMERLWVTKDWEATVASFLPTYYLDDRRPLMRLRAAGNEFFASLRMLFDLPRSRWHFQPLATRGERLALGRVLHEAAADESGGASAVEFLDVFEVDAAGMAAAEVVFDPADEDAAYAELDARFAAGLAGMEARAWEECRAVVAALNARDWEAFAALFKPGYASRDHRLLHWGQMLSDPAVLVQSVQLLVELAPDCRTRLDHVRVCQQGALVQATELGTRDGGGFETPYLWVATVEGLVGVEDGFDLYDLNQIDQARARFAELASPAPSAEPFANAASATAAPVIAAIVAHDWQRFAQLFADDFRMSDRRRVVQLELDRDQYVAFTREVGNWGTGRAESELLATRGERLALQRLVYEFSGADVGPSEIAFLILTEVDARGRIVAYVRWDVEDLDAAYAELDARWQAGEAAAHPRVAAYHAAFTRALASRAWDALVALHAPTLVAHDHRLVGWDVLRGPSAYVVALQAMVDLAPDVDSRVDHLRTSERGMIAEIVWGGTRDGGAFESPFIWVVELDAAGLAQRLDFYDPHHLDAAWARFEEIRRSTPDAPLAAVARPNAATATLERWRATFLTAFDSEDWDAIRALCAPDMTFEDRRRMALLSGDRELMIASARERARTGARPEGWTIGTAGDRVVVSRTLFSGGPPDGRFEIEYLSVVEVDAAGLFTAIIFFDLDDARAAQREAWARWAAIDPVAAPWVKLSEAIVTSFDAHDRDLVPFTDDVVVDDHRRTGLGRIEGRDAYFESLKALWEVAPDQRMEMGWFWPAVERHGFVTFVKRHGTLPDGGAFESELVWLGTATAGRITRLELFEIEDVDKAVARLADLRPDPLRIPPNAATRTLERWETAAAAGDWDTLRALYDPSFRYEDRRRLLRMTGDRDTALVNDRYLFEGGWRVKQTPLATAGDRLALQRVLWTVGETGAISEVEMLEIDEVACEGRFVWTAVFDPEDRAAASAEFFERYAAGEGRDVPPVAFDVVRSWNAHDLERLRALLPADFYLDDHRRTGVGRLDGADAYLASLAAVWELSRDLRIETLYIIATEAHGTLYVCRWFGTNAEGGEFDAVYVCLGLARGDQPVGLEIFELDDLDAVRARFEALRPPL